jgi:hypothetical protein
MDLTSVEPAADPMVFPETASKAKAIAAALDQDVMRPLGSPNWIEGLARVGESYFRTKAAMEGEQDRLDTEANERQQEQARRAALTQASQVTGGAPDERLNAMIGALSSAAPEQAAQMRFDDFQRERGMADELAQAESLIPLRVREQREVGDVRVDQSVDEARRTLPFAASQRSPGMSAPPSGYRFTGDGNLEAIPGGPADIRANDAGRAQAGRLESSERSLQNAVDALNEAEGLISWDSTGGVGQALRGVGGTAARDLDQALEPVRAILSFETLAEMRRNSETGGALGSIAVRELELLGNTMRSLDTAQSTRQVQSAVRSVRSQLQRTQTAVRAAREEMGGGVQQQPQGGGAPSRLRYNPATGQIE